MRGIDGWRAGGCGEPSPTNREAPVRPSALLVNERALLLVPLCPAGLLGNDALGNEFAVGDLPDAHRAGYVAVLIHVDGP